MAKTFYRAITDDDRHAVATLIAAGLRPHGAAVSAGVTNYALRKVMAEAGWDELLASKRSALAELMRGDA